MLRRLCTDFIFCHGFSKGLQRDPRQVPALPCSALQGRTQATGSDRTRSSGQGVSAVGAGSTGGRGLSLHLPPAVQSGMGTGTSDPLTSG